MSDWDGAAFYRWLTTDPENQPVLPVEPCPACGRVDGTPQCPECCDEVTE